MRMGTEIGREEHIARLPAVSIAIEAWKERLGNKTGRPCQVNHDPRLPAFVCLCPRLGGPCPRREDIAFYVVLVFSLNSRPLPVWTRCVGPTRPERPRSTTRGGPSEGTLTTRISLLQPDLSPRETVRGEVTVCDRWWTFLCVPVCPGDVNSKAEV